MLTLENVRVTLDGWDLTASFGVPEGARVGVIGPSGAGKSTLLGAIAGFHDLAAGRVLWRGRDISGDAPGARPVSMIFQDGNVFPHLTVAQNVGLGLQPGLRLSPSELDQVEGALAHVGLAGFGARKPAQLSGGQLARVPLARVLLMQRPLFLLDEPFGALGPALKAEMLALVRDLVTETGATMLMVSHEPEDAQAICDRIVFVESGRAHPPAPVDEIFANPPAALQSYLGK